jgi:hypothetical protein
MEFPKFYHPHQEHQIFINLMGVQNLQPQLLTMFLIRMIAPTSDAIAQMLRQCINPNQKAKGLARKLIPKYIGPYKIVQDFRNQSFKIELPVHLKK